MTSRRTNVYVWVTWLSRLLVGDASCEWTSWFKAHHGGHPRAGRDFSLSTWNMHHTRLLNYVREKFEADGHTVTTERAYWFRLQGGSGALVSGQADLIAVAPDGQVTVYDVKTGAQRDSDVAQVMICMYALPLVADSPGQESRSTGAWCTGTARRSTFPPTRSALTSEADSNDLIKRMVFDDPERSMPSPAECNW